MRKVILASALAASLLGFCIDAAAAPAADPKEGKLALPLPEVVVESPDIARLIARRVRPTPPGRLGVRLPDVLAQAEIPEADPPARPIPPEREPDMDLANVMGGISRIFGDADKLFESGLAYLKRRNPVEALVYFDKAIAQSEDRRLRAAALFWSVETLLRLGRPKEALGRRSRLLWLPRPEGGRYAAAVLYAMARERCLAKDFAACLETLKRGRWQVGGFASREARFLRAWALAQSGERSRAREIYSFLAEEGGPLSLRALVALGHLQFRAERFSRAERTYLRMESMPPPRSAAEAAYRGEALHGIGWARLRLGRAETAGRAFAHFFRRHPDHPLRRSAEAGALAARIETSLESPEKVAALQRALAAFAQKYPEGDQLGPLRLQLAWAMFRGGRYGEAAKLAAAVSDIYPLGRVYRLARVVEGLSLYHLGKVRRAYGVLRLGADRPPAGAARAAERLIARSAAMATAFAAFRLKDFAGARAVLEPWAFPGGGGAKAKAADAEAALWYGEAAFEAGDLKRAHLAFSSMPEGTEEWLRAQAGLSWILYRRKEWDAAAAAFDKVFALEPGGPLAPEALARAGEARFNLGNHAGALSAFEKIEREFAGRPVARQALLQKGKLLFRRDRFEKAGEAFARFLKRYPKSAEAPEVEFLSALIPFRRMDYARSRRMLLAFIERRPKSALVPDAYLRVGDAFYNEGVYIQADRIYRLMMNRFPRHARARDAAYGLILARLQQEDYARFLEEAKKFIGRNPGDSLSISLAFQIGEVLLAREDLDGALRAYVDVATRYASSVLAAHALLRVGDIHRRRGDMDAFLTTIETLLERYPNSPLHADALFLLGNTLAASGRCGEALDRLKAFLDRYAGHDNETLARFVLGRCAAKAGEEALALEHLGRVARDEEDRAGVRSRAALLQAALLLRKGKLRE
ncbi:MAG: tetratricopeptide repeat protein, partial [bacterium]